MLLLLIMFIALAVLGHSWGGVGTVSQIRSHRFREQKKQLVSWCSGIPYVYPNRYVTPNPIGFIWRGRILSRSDREGIVSERVGLNNVFHSVLMLLNIEVLPTSSYRC